MITADYWFRIITELEQHMGLREIAEKVGTSTTSLFRIKAGEYEPRHSAGERLIALHRMRICSIGGTPPVIASRVEPPG